MKTFYKTLSLAAILACSMIVKSQNIYTYAGNGVQGYSGDGGQASAAELRFPSSICKDNLGNLLIVDQGNYVIRKVTPSGVISTIAGMGVSGFTGDGGPATAAELYLPQQIWVDTITSFIYIADEAVNRIRQIDNAGIITTIAGKMGGGGYTGDGVQATATKLNGPWGVALDLTGNKFIGDSGNNRIRKVDITGIISTVAGNGVSGYSGDGGPATSAEIFDPTSMRTDVSGNIYWGELGNAVVRKIDVTSGNISTIAGTPYGGYSGDGGQATAAELDQPTDVFLDGSGNIFIADFYNNVVRMVDPSGIITTIAGNGYGAGLGYGGYTGDGGPATDAELMYPQAVYADASSNLYIADFNNSVVRVVKPISTNTKTIAAADEPVTLFPNPANDIITINASKKIEAVQVCNLIGELMDDYNYGNNAMISKQIDVSKYPVGVYFIKIRSNGKEMIRKAVISR